MIKLMENSEGYNNNNLQGLLMGVFRDFHDLGPGCY